MREAAFRMSPGYLQEEKSTNVSNELPDLDEDVSFVVDAGAPTGPIPMRSIIDSIRSGERLPDVLVWWAGAPEWVQFDANEPLFELLQDLPATNQPPPPPDLDDDVELHDESVIDEDAWLDDVEVAEPAERFPEPHVTTFDIPVDQSDIDDSDIVDDSDSDVPYRDDELDDQVISSIAAEAEADVLLGRDSRSMHPSNRWGVDGPPSPGPNEVEASRAEPVGSDSSLTGLFSASARSDAGLSGEALAPSPSDIASSTRQSLENVGARIDALTSATRRARRFDADALDEEDLDPSADVLAPTHAAQEQEDMLAAEAEAEDAGELRVAIEAREPDDTDDTDDTEFDELASSSGSWQSVTDFSEADDSAEPAVALDDRFAEMVRKSVEHQRRLDWATRVDELLLSACITAIVDSGYLLLDSSSDDSDHQVLFDHNDDSRQVRLELSPLSPLNAAGDHVGRHVHVGLAWGREVADRDDAFSVVRSEATDGEVLPGSFTCEVNMVAGTASTNVGLIWAADDFVRDDHSVDRASLDASIAAVLRALETRWYELFQQAL